MGRFADDMEIHQIGGSTFQFSAVKLDRLESDQYTLVTVVFDVSGSTVNFQQRMKAAIQAAVRRLRHGPHADNLQLRFLVFDDLVVEVFGFRPLQDVADDDVVNFRSSGRMTALCDACCSGVEAMTAWATQLRAQHFHCNGCLIVVTDGQENASKTTTRMVAAAITRATQSETLMDVNSILVGVNTDDGDLDAYLDAFHREVGFRQYVPIGKATEEDWAKLEGFVSASISSSSQALATGGQSQSVSF